MKYLGKVVITDEDGGSVFERELTADEMISELVDTRKRTIGWEVPRDTIPEVKEAIEPEPAPYRPEHTKGCPECGSLGKRHKKECPRTGGATKAVGKKEPKVSAKKFGGKFTEEQKRAGLDRLKELMNGGMKHSPAMAKVAKEYKCSVNTVRWWETHNDAPATPAGKKLDEEEDAWNDYLAPLTKDQFEMVRDMSINDGKSSLQIASELDFALEDVSTAYRCRTYEDFFTASRKRDLGHS